MYIPVAKVRWTKKIAQQPISLETPVGKEQDSHLGDFIEDKVLISPSDAVINLNLKEQTASVLKLLTPRRKDHKRCTSVSRTAASTRSGKWARCLRSPANAYARSKPRRCASCATLRGRTIFASSSNAAYEINPMGRTLRMLISDRRMHAWSLLAIRVGRRLGSYDVIEALADVMQWRGISEHMRSDTRISPAGILALHLGRNR